MPINVQCPKCKGLLSVAAQRPDTRYKCPFCGEAFQVSPSATEQALGEAAGQDLPAQVPRPPEPPVPPSPGSIAAPGVPPPAASPGGPPAGSGDPRSATGQPPPPTAPPPVQLPARTGNVARFVTPETTTEPHQLGADGELPELTLRETQGEEKKKETPSFTLSPAVLSSILCLSLVLSVALLLVDTGHSAPAKTRHAIASQFLKDYYLPPTDARAPRPYGYYLEKLFPEEFGPGRPSPGYLDLPQVSDSNTEKRHVRYLRNALLARERSDPDRERRYYRRALRLLRQETPPGVREGEWSVTETRDKDEILKKVIAVLLSNG